MSAHTRIARLIGGLGVTRRDPTTSPEHPGAQPRARRLRTARAGERPYSCEPITRILLLHLVVMAMYMARFVFDILDVLHPSLRRGLLIAYVFSTTVTLLAGLTLQFLDQSQANFLREAVFTGRLLSVCSWCSRVTVPRG